MSETFPSSLKTLKEALALAEDLLKNIELAEIPLANIALKASRLARILNDYDMHQILTMESSGYPMNNGRVLSEHYRLAAMAGREFQQVNPTTKQIENYIYVESIEALEQEVLGAETEFNAARDPDVSVSSSNPNQMVYNPVGNKFERNAIRDKVAKARRRLSTRRTLIYSYVLAKFQELKFSGIASDIFSRIRESVESAIGQKVPNAIQKLNAVYENLQSENPEDWANAVHSCRRILQDLSNTVFPACDDVTKQINGKERLVKMGEDAYINRLIAYVEGKSSSDRFNEIVGSHLGYLGDRLDSVFRAAQKGSHSVVTKTEADRYVVYTYLIVGDILTLDQG